MDYFDAAKINVVNRAVGGLSSRTYLTQGDWDRVLAMLKPGDFVMMQFGHNDGGPLDDAARARGTLKGTGEETHGDRQSDHQAARSGPHLRLVSEEVHRRRPGQGRDADHVHADSAQDLEGRQDRAKRRRLRRMGGAGGGSPNVRRWSI